MPGQPNKGSWRKMRQDMKAPAKPAASPKKFHVFTEEEKDRLKGEIIERIANAETLLAIVAEPNMPSRPTINSWRATDEQFRLAFEGAMELRADALIERREVIAMSATAETAQLARMQTDVLLGNARAIAPHRYSEKVLQQTTVHGKVEHEHRIEATDEERKAAILTLFGEKKRLPAFVDLALESSASPAPIEGGGSAQFERVFRDDLARIGNPPKPVDPLEQLSRGKG